ncbi:MAG: WbqC family protein [Pirellulales bacterium]|nr:WbqC family protein [Pirellulales bacterium]
MAAVDSKAHVAGILQPSFLPWLGYIAQIHRADTFVLYDDAQFDKNSWRNRNRIKTAAGIKWLTVPVKATLGTTIRDVRVENSRNWARKHVSSIQQSYAKAAYFAEHEDLLHKIYDQDWDFLLDLNVFALREILKRLGLERTILFSSELQVEGRATERLVNICREIGANHFFEGAAGRDYIDQRVFDQHDITLEYQDYQHPTYQQPHGEFASHLSIIDLLLNCGPRSLEILCS